MMYWLGIVLLALGLLVLGFTNPWQFFQAAEGGFFDWTDLFWVFQWGGFWSITASLLLFGGLAWRAPSKFAAHWKLVPPGIALLLFVLFFFCSMPEKSNKHDWKNGWVGARVYWRTKLWLRGDDGDENALPGRLAGTWEAPGGFLVTISPDAVRMTTPSGNTEWSARRCPYRFRMEYDFTFRSVLTQPLPAGLAFTPFDFKMREPAAWIVVDIDRLMAFPEPDRMLIARRR